MERRSRSGVHRRIRKIVLPCLPNHAFQRTGTLEPTTLRVSASEPGPHEHGYPAAERGYKYREINMPTISMFFGIVVSFYFIDNRKHKHPHIHVKYQDSEAVISIPHGKLLEGELPPAKMRLVLAWIEIHKDELMADWDLAVSGQQPFKIDPLR